MPDLWALRHLDAIERRYPTDEVRALVAEIRLRIPVGLNAESEGLERQSDMPHKSSQQGKTLCGSAIWTSSATDAW